MKKLDITVLVISNSLMALAILNEIADNPLWAIANIMMAIWVLVFRLLARKP